MRIFKNILKIAFVIALFLAINAGFTFFFTPSSTSSSQMWDLYRDKDGENLDMIYVGTSACLEGIDPSVVDESTGLVSYNMGTNSQTYVCSKKAILEAIKDHGISQVVFVFDEVYLMEGMVHNARAEASFLQAKSRGDSVGEKVSNALSYIFARENAGEVYSLNYFFPWLVNRIQPKNGMVLKELMIKLGLTEAVMADSNNLREEDGFKPFHYTIDYNKLSCKDQVFDENEVSREALSELDEIISICRENAVAINFVVPPYPTATVLSWGESYMQRVEYIKDFLSAYDVGYYDFNLAKPALYEHHPEYFKDETHNNLLGAEAFSKSLGELLSRLSSGENMDYCFYSDYEDYLTSITWVDSVELSAKAVSGEGIYLTAEARTGSKVKPLYCFQYYDESSGEYVSFRSFSEDNCALFVPEKDGNYKLRVVAQPDYSSNDSRRYKTINISYYSKA